MDRRVLLGCSVALNVLLAAWLVLLGRTGESIAGRTQLPTSRATLEIQDATAGFPSTAELHRLLEQLNASEVGQETAKAIVAAMLQVESSASPVAFWEPLYLQQAKKELARFNRQQHAEDTLIALFGPKAEQDAVFARVFAPLREHFPFLAPVKQRRMQRVVVDANRELAALAVGPGLASGRSRVLSKLAEQIEELLGPEDFSEYQLRRSALAQQLRNLEFRFSEDEFRRMFVLHATAGFNPAQAPLRIAPHANGDLSTRIREILGEQRFRQYEMIQDPRYKVLSALAAQFAVPDANVEQVYALLRDADSQAESLQKDGPVMSLDAREKWLAADHRRREKLRALLGEKAYAAGSAMLDIGVHNLAAAPASYSPNSARTAVPLRALE